MVNSKPEKFYLLIWLWLDLHHYISELQSAILVW